MAATLLNYCVQSFSSALQERRYLGARYRFQERKSGSALLLKLQERERRYLTFLGATLALLVGGFPAGVGVGVGGLGGALTSQSNAIEEA